MGVAEHSWDYARARLASWMGAGRQLPKTPWEINEVRVARALGSISAGPYPLTVKLR